jgi:2-desacetyl-2-hydroxyethyl bacteriochlorophyllide A dehydrogenase
MDTIPQIMRAIEFPALGTVAVTTMPFPAAPMPGEVLLRTEYLGICGTDLHLLHGRHPWVRPPVIIGHECVATVMQTGAANGRIRPGQRVVVNPLFTCGHCRACVARAPNHCEAAKVMGFRLPGAGRTHFVVSESQLHHVPEGVDPKLASLAEPLAVGIHAASRAADLEKVMIIGGGTIGLCVLLAALMRNAGEVRVVEPVASKRALALKLGAREAIAPESITDASGYTTVFDCVANQATLDAACRATIGGGTVVVVGVAEAMREIPMPRLQRFEIDLIGSGMYVPADIDAAIAALAHGLIDAAALITAVRSIDVAPAAYEEAMEPDSIKVLITMN